MLFYFLIIYKGKKEKNIFFYDHGLMCILYGTKAFKIKNTKYDVSCKIMPKVVLMENGSQLPAL